MDGFRPVTHEALDAAGDDPLLGATLAERYTIVGRVGSGGMGTVYRAEQAPMGREVALKVLRRDLGRDPETVARFQREARALSQLKHPNTVTLFDFGQTDDGLLYLAMELLEGEMLSARLRTVGAMDVLEAIRIATGVLRSLDEAHARHIVHRDLKPDNIFLAKVHGRADDAEMVKVLDFGIAKIRHGDDFPGMDPVATQEGTVFGTPRYMSPEQAQAKSLDGRSDLYAVGVLLFHMLTGSPPFTDDDAVVVMAHHIKTIPPGVRLSAPDRPIPPSLEALIVRCLSKDPDDRPGSAADFLAALEDTLPDVRALREIVGVALSIPSPIPQDPSLRRRWIAILALASAVLAVSLSLALVATRPNPRALSASVVRIHRAWAAPRPAIPAPHSAGTVSPSPTPPPEALPTVPSPLAATPGGNLQRPHRHRAAPPEVPMVTVVPPAAPARPAPAPQIYHRWND